MEIIFMDIRTVMAGFAKISRAENYFGTKKRLLAKGQSHMQMTASTVWVKEMVVSFLSKQLLKVGDLKENSPLIRRLKKESQRQSLDSSGHSQWKNVSTRSRIDLLLRHQWVNPASSLFQPKTLPSSDIM